MPLLIIMLMLETTVSWFPWQTLLVIFLIIAFGDMMDKSWKSNMIETNYVSSSKQNFYKMYLIRLFEMSLLNMFHKGYLFGTTHTCIGQEAIPVALQVFLNEGDIILSNHRCHGHYLAKTDDVEGLLLEIQGHEAGICKGRGGSQHLYRKNFITNGIQGNLFPVSVGMAFQQKRLGQKNIVVIYVGDGTFGQGVLYEGLNLASLLKVPLLIVVENNQYAQSTSVNLNLAGTLLKRADAFDIRANEIESNDVDQLCSVFDEAVKSVRHRDPIQLKRAKMTEQDYSEAIDMVEKRFAKAMENLSNIIDVKRWKECIPAVPDYAIH